MRAIYLLLISAGLFLASCGSSYRVTQTVDDVYYSPSVQDQEYVTVYNDRERESYNYREDYEIRRGIRNPVYRNSISYSMSFGFGSPFYSSFYSPFYSPFSSFGYYSPFGHYGYGSPFYSSFYFGSFYNPYGYYPYGSLYHGYYPSYGYYPSHGYGGYYPSYRVYDNGPRRTSLGNYNNAGLRTINTPGRVNTAPVRSVSPDTRRESSSPIRRIFAPNENRNVSPSRAPVRQSREYAPARSNSDRRYSPAPARQSSPRSTSPARSNNNTRQAPTRNFQPSSTPSRSYERSSSPAPSRSSGTSTGTGPRRG